MITKDKYIYSIDENNAITVWEKDKHDAGEPPFIWQPFNPDNKNLPFETTEEATTWVETRLDAMINPPTPEPTIGE